MATYYYYFLCSHRDGNVNDLKTHCGLTIPIITFDIVRVKNMYNIIYFYYVTNDALHSEVLKSGVKETNIPSKTVLASLHNEGLGLW